MTLKILIKLFYSESALHRDEWNKNLDEIFAQYHFGEGSYRKNYEDIYNIVDSFDGLKTAIRNAKRRMADFDDKKVLPSKYDPGTKVHELVLELIRYLDE